MLFRIAQGLIWEPGLCYSGTLDVSQLKIYFLNFWMVLQQCWYIGTWELAPVLAPAPIVAMPLPARRPVALPGSRLGAIPSPAPHPPSQPGPALAPAWRPWAGSRESCTRRMRALHARNDVAWRGVTLGAGVTVAGASVQVGARRGGLAGVNLGREWRARTLFGFQAWTRPFQVLRVLNVLQVLESIEGPPGPQEYWWTSRSSEYWRSSRSSEYNKTICSSRRRACDHIL